MANAPTKNASSRRISSLPILWTIGGVVLAAMPVLASAVFLISVRPGPDYAGGAVFHINSSLLIPFALFALIYLTFPRLVGLKPNRRLAIAHFCAMFIGVIIVTAPGFALDVSGLPEHSRDYPTAFAILNGVQSAGYGLMATSLLIFLAVVIEALVRRRRA